MDRTIERLLRGEGENHLLPFFWQHGESEAVLREYMGAIQAAGCGAVCVESRPHPDFCGPGWWRDLDVILDEARARGMQVWILDDSHFPTGYANGAVKNAPGRLRRKSVCSSLFQLDGPARTLHFPVRDLMMPQLGEDNPMEAMIKRLDPPHDAHDPGDRLLSVTAWGPQGQCVELTAAAGGETLEWQKPAGAWTLCTCLVSRNCGPHRDYINMLEADSCRLLLDAVYEPHYRRYAADFGKTIAGFFSDEPELGNGHLYGRDNPLGTQQDLPWSDTLEQVLAARLGEGWQNCLPLLWLDGPDKARTAHLRYTYMDAVTRLVEQNFSFQLGDWCRAHGVQYIGHVIEDENQHCRTGSSLGHYFRGLAGQDMAGIDDIGGQVLPQGEDRPETGSFGRRRSGSFYHFVLGRLAASAAAIEPAKRGRAMCEIFGNYGWGAGVQLEKYLVDHFLAQGVNYFVPHAFDPAPFPDSDCPPHFYAHGNQPQYRHFGALMRYTNRLCNVLSGGRRTPQAALLYHGEAEWAGPCGNLDAAARQLTERQFDFDILPADVFSQPARFGTRLGAALQVNTQRYRALLLPAAEYLPAAVLQAAAALQQAGCLVAFLDRRPQGCCDEKTPLPQALGRCPVVPVTALGGWLAQRLRPAVRCVPPAPMLRCLRYEGSAPVYFFVNEAAEPYVGAVELPEQGPCYLYDAWENKMCAAPVTRLAAGMRLQLALPPRHSLLLVLDDVQTTLPPPLSTAGGRAVPPETAWRRSVCTAREYPAFGAEKAVSLPDDLAREQPAFSGFVRYRALFQLAADERTLLELSDAAEGVAVFCNGHSAGLQVVPPYRYDLTPWARGGENEIVIEVATTLERALFGTGRMPPAPGSRPGAQSGITGTVAVVQKPGQCAAGACIAPQNPLY